MPNPLLPGKLAIYYGWPSVVNDPPGSLTAWEKVDRAVKIFRAYDVVVFGNGLQSSTHGDHGNTTDIVGKLTDPTNPDPTEVYGYIPLGLVGASSPSLSLSGVGDTIEQRVDDWQEMGVTGIFFDQAGYDFGVPRQRQNAAVQIVRQRVRQYDASSNLNVFINAWIPDHVFSPDVDAAFNPPAEGTLLGDNDIYLSESFQIVNGAFQEQAFWADKADSTLAFKQQYGTRVATVTTTCAGMPFSREQFDYAWWSTLLYGFDYMGWGEADFSAADSKLPYRDRPPEPEKFGTFFRSPVVTHSPPLHSRRTGGGTVWIKYCMPAGAFRPRSPRGLLRRILDWLFS